jgi:hypothetical protein
VTVIADRHQERFLNALHLDDSGSLGVLSTPIKTRWKGLLVRRKLLSAVSWLCGDNTNRLRCSRSNSAGLSNTSATERAVGERQ